MTVGFFLAEGPAFATQAGKTPSFSLKSSMIGSLLIAGVSPET